MILEPFTLFTPEECEEIIRAAQSEAEREGLAAGRYSPDVRNNHIYWWRHPDPGRFHHLLTQYEEYPVTWLQEPFQVSRYDTGRYYEWHTDRFVNSRTSARLLTLTCTLQAAPEARFETKDRSYELKTGEAIIFPSDMEHRATPPIKGTRWAFTVWAMGQNPKLNKLSS